jgi:hypothetical protein
MDKAKFWMFLCLGFPAVVNFLIMWWFRDAFISLIFVIGTFYAVPLAYNKMAGEFDWKVKLAPEMPNFTDKKKQMDSKHLI